MAKRECKKSNLKTTLHELWELEKRVLWEEFHDPFNYLALAVICWLVISSSVAAEGPAETPETGAYGVLVDEVEYGDASRTYLTANGVIDGADVCPEARDNGYDAKAAEADELTRNIGPAIYCEDGIVYTSDGESWPLEAEAYAGDAGIAGDSDGTEYVDAVPEPEPADAEPATPAELEMPTEPDELAYNVGSAIYCEDGIVYSSDGEIWPMELEPYAGDAGIAGGSDVVGHVDAVAEPADAEAAPGITEEADAEPEDAESAETSESAANADAELESENNLSAGMLPEEANTGDEIVEDEGSADVDAADDEVTDEEPDGDVEAEAAADEVDTDTDTDAEVEADADADADDAVVEVDVDADDGEAEPEEEADGDIQDSEDADESESEETHGVTGETEPLPPCTYRAYGLDFTGSVKPLIPASYGYGDAYYQVIPVYCDAYPYLLQKVSFLDDGIVELQMMEPWYPGVSYGEYVGHEMNPRYWRVASTMYTTMDSWYPGTSEYTKRALQMYYAERYMGYPRISDSAHADESPSDEPEAPAAPAPAETLTYTQAYVPAGATAPVSVDVVVGSKLDRCLALRKFMSPYWDMMGRMFMAALREARVGLSLYSDVYASAYRLIA